MIRGRRHQQSIGRYQKLSTYSEDHIQGHDNNMGTTILRKSSSSRSSAVAKNKRYNYWVIKKMSSINGESLRLKGLKMRRSVLTMNHNNYNSASYWNINKLMNILMTPTSSVVTLPTSIKKMMARIYAQVVKRLNKMETALTVYPSIVLSSTQWGLPVLSHY